jgi:hypothetical protein
MLKIKNKRANIPGGYLYVQRETNWDAYKVMPHTINDFYAVAQAIRQHRLANPSFKLSTSMPAIEEELERVNVARIAAIPGAAAVYLMEVGGASPSFHQAPTPTLPLPAAVKSLSAGARTILDFEESGEPPVSNELATKRAEICVTCPKNETGGLSRFFTIPASELIKKQLERAHEMKLTTPLDNQLNVCSACLCPLKLKVHFPLAFILKHMSEEVKAKLDGRCWILGEDFPEKEAA